MLFCRRSLHPRSSKKSERKRPSFYTNPIAPHSSIRSGQVIIAMEELQDGAVPEGDYEEPEDEVQEVGGELSVGSLSNDVFLDRNRKWNFSSPRQAAILNKFLGKSSLLFFFLFYFFYNNVIAFRFLPIAQGERYDFFETAQFSIVFQVVAHFTDDGFSNKHGVTHFSVADEDEDESPAAQPDKDRKRQSQEVPENSQPQAVPIRVYETEPNREDSVGARGKPRRGPSQHIYETVN